jgi:hypothetical protein
MVKPFEVRTRLRTEKPRAVSLLVLGVRESVRFWVADVQSRNSRWSTTPPFNATRWGCGTKTDDSGTAAAELNREWRDSQWRSVAFRVCALVAQRESGGPLN